MPALPETDEIPVLHYEFARDVDAYLARLPADAPVRSMAELAAWNDAHPDAALKYGQAHVLAALAVDHEADAAAYRANRARDLAMAGEHGIDATLSRARRGRRRHAVLARRGRRGASRLSEPRRPGRLPAGRPPAVRRLLPRARPGSEALLLGLGYAYEQASKARRPVSRVNPALLR